MQITKSELLTTIDTINQYLLSNETIESLRETISKLNTKLNN